ncbi:hypothetical protein Pth03_49740 [Planotetraspora thailandica]|uniref:Uncharacterized protein n=1 Tax=Planotetraspora thailandica TaxID=487172 RepID=A0A8J3XXW4_9ACTN|nr:hypothetical protein Pth03_49740 [Planotetraspora thailandica]
MRRSRAAALPVTSTSRKATDAGQAAREDRVSKDVTPPQGLYRPLTQILDENHVTIAAGGITFSPIRLRLAHPPEFDLMAREL